MTHLGRDFSSFQGDLTPADCEGIDFAYCKATQGGEYKNPDAPQQCAALRRAGVKVGYYHFFTMTDLVGDQLNNFHQMAQALGATPLPLALDSETVDPGGWPDLAAKMMDFATGVEGWTNWVPHPRSLLYVNLTFYHDLEGFPWGRWVWLADPNAGAPHEPCLILQAAPRAVSATDLKSVDPDTFLGSEAAWAAFSGSVAAPEPTPEPPTITQDPEDEVQSTPVTFKTDGNGNAWIGSPLPIGKVVNAVPVNIDPAKVGTYTNVPRFAGVTADNQLVFEAGAPNAEFGFVVWATD